MQSKMTAFFGLFKEKQCLKVKVTQSSSIVLVEKLF